MAFEITADSIPVLDGWGFDDYWDCYDWINWHKQNKAKYGSAAANQKFLQEFDKQGLGASALDCRTGNEVFKQYAKAEGFYEFLFSGLAGLAHPISAGVSGANAASNILGNASDALGGASKYLKYVIPTILGLLLIAILTYAFKDSKSNG